MTSSRELIQRLENLRGLGDDGAAAEIIDDIHGELLGDQDYLSAQAYDLLPTILDLVVDPRTAGRVDLLEELEFLAADEERFQSNKLATVAAKREGSLRNLLDANKTPDPAVRREATRVLAQLLPMASPDLPTVMAALREQDGVAAASTATEISRAWRTEDVLPILASLAQDSRDDVKLKAVQGLALWGTRVRPYAGQLAAALDGAPQVYAVAALGMIGDPRSLPVIKRLLTDRQSPYLHWPAVSVPAALPPLDVILGPLADHAGELLPVLRPLLGSDVELPVRREVASTLARWGEVAAPAIPELTAMLHDVRDPGPAYGAIWRLLGMPTDREGRKLAEAATEAALAHPDADGLERVAAFGPLAGKYERRIRKLADKHESWQLRTPAGYALWRVAGAGEELLRAAIAAVTPGRWERWLRPAITHLSEIGPVPPDLRNLANSERRLENLPPGWQTVIEDLATCDAVLAALPRPS